MDLIENFKLLQQQSIEKDAKIAKEKADKEADDKVKAELKEANYQEKLKEFKAGVEQFHGLKTKNNKDTIAIYFCAPFRHPPLLGDYHKAKDVVLVNSNGSLMSEGRLSERQPLLLHVEILEDSFVIYIHEDRSGFHPKYHSQSADVKEAITNFTKALADF